MKLSIPREKISCFLFIIILLLACCPAWGQNDTDISRLEDDLRPIEAVAQKASDNTFVLDKGKDVGIKAGDLFALLDKAEPIYLPGTKKVLGYKEKLVAKCQVHEVRPDSSLCRVYFSKGTLKDRLKALRFTGLRAALFIDNKLVSPVFSTYSLKRMLPNLKWLEPSSGPMPVPSESSMEAFGIDLVFDLKDGELKVYGPGKRMLTAYKVPSSEGARGVDTQGEYGNSEGSATLAPFVFDFKRATLVGTLEGRALQVAVTDLDGDGKREVIYLTSDALAIAPYRRSGDTQFVHFEDFECPCSFSYWGKWLVLNVAINNAGLSSKLYAFRDGRLELVQDEINLWLGFAHTDCNSQGKVLLGQAYEKERFKGERIFYLNPTPSGIEYVDQADFPNDFDVQSALAVERDGVCTLFYVSFDGFFKVYARGSHVWTSLFPVVEERKCCGPSKVELLKYGNGLLFQGVIPGSKGTGEKGLYYFPFDGFGFLRADANLKGSLCGVSRDSKAIIIGVTSQEKEGWKTYLYQFSTTDLSGEHEESS
ncbi:MAG: hypothetical protein GXO58_05825 [Thermodesulfobacteria bacterium]|nr:hypothetical protein [Thermodesulfobacteriota bacterium]